MMIEKLPTPTPDQVAFGIKERDIHNKINELVEAVNELKELAKMGNEIDGTQNEAIRNNLNLIMKLVGYKHDYSD